MATRITFKSAAAHSVFHSMIEGMWEVRRDDIVSPDGRAVENDSRAKAYESLIAATPDSATITYPAAFDLPRTLRAVAQDVLANCLDNNEDLNPDERDEDSIYPGDVTIDPPDRLPAAMDCATALSLALEYIDLSGIEDHNPQAREVAKALLAMIEQQGCEEFGAGGEDGKLTTMMDIIIYG